MFADNFNSQVDEYKDNFAFFFYSLQAKKGGKTSNCWFLLSDSQNHFGTGVHSRDTQSLWYFTSISSLENKLVSKSTAYNRGGSVRF